MELYTPHTKCILALNKIPKKRDIQVIHKDKGKGKAKPIDIQIQGLSNLPRSSDFEQQPERCHYQRTLVKYHNVGPQNRRVLDHSPQMTALRHFDDRRTEM